MDQSLYELILQGMRDGRVIGRDNEPLFWVSVEQRQSVRALKREQGQWSSSSEQPVT